MDCEQARTSLEQLAVEGIAISPDAERHLGGCTACQAWYMEEIQVLGAMGALRPVPVPADFTARVLAQLAEATPAWAATESARLQRPHPSRWAALWESLQLAWRNLTARRRLAPALVIAFSLILVLGLWSSWRGESLPILPGTAITSGAALSGVPWFLGGLAGLSALILLIALARK